MITSIVIPTLNEAATIEAVVTQLSELPMDTEIIVVDDGSTDGTVERARELPVTVIEREADPDLSRAALDGFNVATGDVYAVIDGDGQHDVRALGHCIQHVRAKADMAIASRHLRCSAAGMVMPVARGLISHGARLLARLTVDEARDTSDPLSGCFAVDAALFEYHRGQYDPIGYKIGLEIMAVTQPERIADVPYRFEERKGGASNMDAGEVVKYLRHLWRLA